MEKLLIGKYVKTHGIKGEIRIKSNFKYKDKVFCKGNKIYLEDNVFYINVKNIRVISEFKYLDLYNNMKNIEKQYIEKMGSI